MTPNLLPHDDDILRDAENDDLRDDAEMRDDDEHDQFLSDAEADGDALASAGMGTDEDYGYYEDCGCLGDE